MLTSNTSNNILCKLAINCEKEAMERRLGYGGEKKKKTDIQLVGSKETGKLSMELPDKHCL